MQYGVVRAAQALAPRVWQEPDELLIYLQIETKCFRLMIQQYFISLTLNREPGTSRSAGACAACEPEYLLL